MEKRPLVYKLPIKRKPKSRQGILYLLMSDDGVYKYGTTRSNVKNRLTWAQRKYQYKFNVINTKIVNRPFRTETMFKWRILNFVELLDSSVEFFRLKPGYLTHDDVIKHFEEVTWDES